MFARFEGGNRLPGVIGDRRIDVDGVHLRSFSSALKSVERFSTPKASPMASSFFFVRWQMAYMFASGWRWKIGMNSAPNPRPTIATLIFFELIFRSQGARYSPEQVAATGRIHSIRPVSVNEKAKHPGFGQIPEPAERQNAFGSRDWKSYHPGMTETFLLLV